jgi:DNA-directed RNA polymerase specialized sigma24 family protein
MSVKSQKLDESIRTCLDEADWSSVFPAVLKYAEARARKFKWLGDEVDPEALVQEAIVRAYGGERNWDREKCPRLENFLIGIIRSMTSHTAEREINFPKLPLYYEDGTLRNGEIFKSSDRTHGASNPKTPEELLIEGDNLIDLMNILDELGSDNEELGMVILCLEYGIGKPREIAKETGYEINKVNNLLRKIRRKLDIYKPKKK